MITPETIEEVKKRLVVAYDPLEIYLFGSYAWGHPSEDSDLDLLVVVKESSLKRYLRSFKASEVLNDLIIPKDIIIYTKDEFDRRTNDKTTLCYKIKTEGKVIYAIA